MSNLVFPSDLPGMDIAVEVEESLPVKIASGGWWAPMSEERTKGVTVQQKRYVLTFNGLRDDVAAPAPWAAYSELGVVQHFWRTHYGSFDTFLFADPDDGLLRRVRFAQDSVKLVKDVAWWELKSLALVTPALPLTVDVTPATATVARQATQQFTATVVNAVADDTVTWSVRSGLGSINASGLYTAPNGATTAVIRATSDEDSGIYDEATVTVL